MVLKARPVHKHGSKSHSPAFSPPPFYAFLSLAPSPCSIKSLSGQSLIDCISSHWFDMICLVNQLYVVRYREFLLSRPLFRPNDYCQGGPCDMITHRESSLRYAPVLKSSCIQHPQATYPAQGFFPASAHLFPLMLSLSSIGYLHWTLSSSEGQCRS